MKLGFGGWGETRNQFWTRQASDIYQSSKKRETHRGALNTQVGSWGEVWTRDSGSAYGVDQVGGTMGSVGSTHCT